ncbi:CHAP domain-containing protein [Streptomyces sp. BBFR109]|uniref:CHAP domain-containing protein n=1 Tax=Streptomyces sp. BBFR109 TaxID=3448172 RepID=UPI003F7690DC
MTAASNADAWAAKRVGIYFQGFPSTLDGQCVSLIKWFLGDMCNVSDWKLARGDAKDYGDTLVRQGLATVVPATQRKRGDIVVWKQDGHGFGHIGVLLSGDRVFEENVGLVGTPSKMVGDFRVFSSRIDPLVANWRTGSPTFYRVKSYEEEGETMTDQEFHDLGTAVYRAVFGREPENGKAAIAMGKKLANKSGVLTPASVTAGLQGERKADEWKQRNEKAKAGPMAAAPASDADKKLNAIKDALGIK